MAITEVREYFKSYNMESRILEFPVSSATVALAAEALECEPNKIAKTLSFLVDNQPILVVTAGDGKIDNKKYKATFHTKAKMLSPDQVTDLIGHGIGGVCPFAVKPGVTTYLDKTLQAFDTVFPACGSSNSAIELTLEELEYHAHAVQWVDVCKDGDVPQL